MTAQKKNIFKLIFTLFLGYILILYFQPFSNINHKIQKIISRIELLSGLETLQLNSFEGSNPTNTPLSLGRIEWQGAYFSIEFSIKGRKTSNPQNLFQTAPQNMGIRLEQIGKTLALIYSTKENSNNYKAVVIEPSLLSYKNYLIKIEALNQSFIRIRINDKLILITSKDINFMANDFLIGGGFNSQRNYKGTIEEINFKKVNFIPYKSKFINKIHQALDDRLFLFNLIENIINMGLLLIFPIFFMLPKCKLKN